MTISAKVLLHMSGENSRNTSFDQLIEDSVPIELKEVDLLEDQPSVHISKLANLSPEDYLHIKTNGFTYVLSRVDLNTGIKVSTPETVDGFDFHFSKPLTFNISNILSIETETRPAFELGETIAIRGTDCLEEGGLLREDLLIKNGWLSVISPELLDNNKIADYEVAYGEQVDFVDIDKGSGGVVALIMDFVQFDPDSVRTTEQILDVSISSQNGKTVSLFS